MEAAAHQPYISKPLDSSQSRDAIHYGKMKCYVITEKFVPLLYILNYEGVKFCKIWYTWSSHSQLHLLPHIWWSDMEWHLILYTVFYQDIFPHPKSECISCFLSNNLQNATILTILIWTNHNVTHCILSISHFDFLFNPIIFLAIWRK
jgi:hypothetical protein